MIPQQQQGHRPEIIKRIQKLEEERERSSNQDFFFFWFLEPLGVLVKRVYRCCCCWEREEIFCWHCLGVGEIPFLWKPFLGILAFLFSLWFCAREREREWECCVCEFPSNFSIFVILLRRLVCSNSKESCKSRKVKSNESFSLIYQCLWNLIRIRWEGECRSCVFPVTGVLGLCLGTLGVYVLW